MYETTSYIFAIVDMTNTNQYSEFFNVAQYDQLLAVKDSTQFTFWEMHLYLSMYIIKL